MVSASSSSTGFKVYNIYKVKKDKNAHHKSVVTRCSRVKGLYHASTHFRQFSPASSFGHNCLTFILSNSRIARELIPAIFTGNSCSQIYPQERWEFLLSYKKAMLFRATTCYLKEQEGKKKHINAIFVDKNVMSIHK